MGVHNLADMQSYKTSVVEGSGDNKVVVVDFFATWCGPCKAIAPAIAKMSEEYSNVSFYKIDVDETPDVAQELGIRAMPTFAVFKNGEKVDEVVGANERALRSKIEALLKSIAEGKAYEKPPAETNWMSYVPMIIIAILVYRYMMGL